MDVQENQRLDSFRFNTKFRWHLDNEFLGQVNSNKIPRAHLLEKSAPLSFKDAAGIRPDINNLSINTGFNVQLIRHSLPIPLVERQEHQGSWYE